MVVWRFQQIDTGVLDNATWAKGVGRRRLARYTVASGTDLDRDGIWGLVGRDEAGTSRLYPGRPGRGYWQRQQLATGW